MPDYSFYDENSQALQKKTIVLRDSLGYLAVKKLIKCNDISAMSDLELVEKLYEIIGDLHSAYLDFIEHNEVDG